MFLVNNTPLLLFQNQKKKKNNNDRVTGNSKLNLKVFSYHNTPGAE